MSGLEAGQRLIGFNQRGDRAMFDFYATPSETTRALLKREIFEGSVWEPCCGEGHISEELRLAGYDVESSDLVDRGYGTSGRDFLLQTGQRDNIVTNPPYGSWALPMAKHATQLARKKVALLLKLQFLEGAKRGAFFAECPPARVWVFSRRQSLMKDGVQYSGGMMALAWFVWDKACEGETVVRWIP